MYYSYVPHTGMFQQQGMRAQSVARSTFTPVYAAPPRKRAFDDEIIHRPFRPVLHSSYDSSGNEYFTRSEINRELLMTSNAMEDNYDIVNMSRNKDKDVLSRAQRAIVNTELHSSPRSAVAARRVMMRGHSTPHEYVPKIVPKTEVALALARAQSIVNRKSLPPASVRRPRVIVKPRYRAHIPVRASISSNTSSREEFESDTVEHTRRAPLSILAYLRYLQLRLLSKHSKPYASYVPIAAYRKAALLGRKVDVVLPAGKRRPRSKYAQDKIRQMRLDKREVNSPENTAGLRASRPVSFQLARLTWDPELSYKTYRLTA